MLMKRYILALSLLTIAAACSTPEKEPETSAPQAQAAPAQTAAPAAPETATAPESSAPEPRMAARTSPAKPSNKPAHTAVSAPVPQPPPAPVPVASTPEPMPAADARNTPIEVPPPARVEPVIRKVTIPSGTLIDVRMIDSISSDTDHVGQTYKASLASPVILDSETVIPKGGDVYVKLVDLKSAGNVKGTSEVRVELDRIFVGQQSYVVQSNTYTQTGESQGKKSAKTIGVGTAIGAAIGAISGGRKGAVIGAGAGAGAGTAVEAATKGAQVRIESESPLTFRLEAPIEVTLSSASSRKP
jgi:hypothetical protein